MKARENLSPILVVDGILTIVTSLYLATTLPVSTELWRILVAVVWLGFAFTHAVGWLAVVLKVSSVRKVLTRLNLLKTYDQKDFLWVYLILTLITLGLQF